MSMVLETAASNTSENAFFPRFVNCYRYMPNIFSPINNRSPAFWASKNIYDIAKFVIMGYNNNGFLP